MTSAKARCRRCNTRPAAVHLRRGVDGNGDVSRLRQTQPFNFLNLDLYAQDTWKLTPKLTWTIRHARHLQLQSPESARCRLARLSGAFDSISHDVNQPLNAVIQTHLGNLFSSTPLAIFQPRTAIAWQLEPNTVLRSGFGIFSDIMPGSVADLIGTNPPYVKTFQGGLLGTVGGTAIAPGVPNSAVDATVAANQNFGRGFSQGELSCASRCQSATCLPPVAITAVPSGKLHAPYFMEWSLGIEHQIGRTASVKAQYVGTRAVNQPYTTQVNGYQTVCPGCFAPFPYGCSRPIRDSRAVTQLSTGANSHYNGLQLTAMKRLGHGLQGQINYTWSHCMEKSRTADFCNFRRAEFSRPCPESFDATMALATTTFATISTRSMCTSCRSRSQPVARAYRNGWQVSGTVFWHSGVPFSVLSTPYSANGNGIVQGSGPQFASLVPGVDPYCRHCSSRLRSPEPFSGSILMLSSPRWIPARAPASAETTRRTASSAIWPERVPRPGFCLERYVSNQSGSSERAGRPCDRRAVLQCLQPPELRPAQHGVAGVPGKPSTQTGFGALTYTTSPPTGLLGVGLGATAVRA